MTDVITPPKPGRASRVNPVLARELRERMRGRRAAAIITIWLTINTLILWLVYQSQSTNNGFDPFGGVQNSSVGRGLYEYVLFTMLLLLFFLVPAQSAGAISGERERQTLLPLQVTLLSPLQIILGKIMASVVFVALLIVTAMPMLAIAFMIGGVDAAEVLSGVAAVLFVGVNLAAMCTAISSFTMRVQSSTVRSFFWVIFLTIGTFVSMLAYAIVDQSRGTDTVDPPSVLLIPNPLAMVADLVGDNAGGRLDSPFDWVAAVIDEAEGRTNSQQIQFDEPAIAFDVEQFPDGGGGVFLDPGFNNGRQILQAPTDDNRIPFWMASASFQLLFSILLVGFAARRLRTPAATER